MTVKVKQDGTITIPADLCEKLGLVVGAVHLVHTEDDAIALIALKDALPGSN